ncbi:MAG: hypothetical protein RLZZ241_1243 [Bacteroidota bacterium]|jgi:hypothetical protein
MKIQHLLLASFIVLFGCSKDKSGIETDSVNIKVNLNLKTEFSLKLDGTSGVTGKTDSEFIHSYDPELTIRFISEASGQAKDFVYNQNESENLSISLPYGSYTWQVIPSIESGTPFADFLPLHGESEESISIDQANVELDLTVETDYALVTVDSQQVTSATLNSGENTMSMPIKEGMYYGYVLSGLTNVVFEVTDILGNNLSADLGLVETCKHYKYILEVSDIGVNILSCDCEVFEVEERYLTPSENLKGIWTKVLDVSNMPSNFNLDGFHEITQYALNKEDSQIYILSNTGNRFIKYNIDLNSFEEEIVQYNLSPRYHSIYNPEKKKIEYLRAGRETVYEMDLTDLSSTLIVSSAFDANHYNASFFYNPFTKEIGQIFGYGYFSVKNSLANLDVTSGWVIDIPNSLNSPQKRTNASLFPNQDYSKIYVLGGIGNQSGNQRESECSNLETIPSATDVGVYCFQSDIWQINLEDNSVTQISDFDPGMRKYGAMGYNYQNNILINYAGYLPMATYSPNMYTRIENWDFDLLIFDISNTDKGWRVIEESGDIPSQIMTKSYFVYVEARNLFYYFRNDGVWTLKL